MAKSAAPRMNVKLLRKIQKHILDEPRRYNQDRWIVTDKEILERASLNGAPPCGTMGCIAGWAHILTSKRKVGQSGSHIIPLARKALGLGTDAAERLFAGISVVYGAQWPKQFVSQYRKAKTQRGRAMAAVRRIDHFIATKGAE